MKKRLIKFTVVGSINALIDFVVFAGLVYIFSISVVPSHIAGFTLAVINSYFMNKIWTFGGANGHKRRSIEFSIFVVTVSIGLVLSTILIWWLEPYIHPLLAKAITTLVVSIGWNFTMSHFAVFRPHKS